MTHRMLLPLIVTALAACDLPDKSVGSEPGDTDGTAGAATTSGGPDASAGGSVTSDGSGGGTGASGQCPGLPAGVEPIEGMGHAAVRYDAPGSDPALWIGVSEDPGLTCDWYIFEEIEDTYCPDGWMFSLILPLGILEPGAYDLATLSKIWIAAFSTESQPGPPCELAPGGGGGTTPVEGTLIVHSVKDGCVVAELVDASAKNIDLRNGGFVAELCGG